MKMVTIDGLEELPTSCGRCDAYVNLWCGDKNRASFCALSGWDVSTLDAGSKRNAYCPLTEVEE